MTEPDQDPPDLFQIARHIAEERDQDVLLYNGGIEQPFDDELANICDQNRAHGEVLLVLVTNGGDPHAAYRMARHLERTYDKFTAFVVGPCKSAGTLLVTGANELVMSDRGELGPLDTQMMKSDELAAMDSGLTVTEALGYLEQQAFQSFQQFFLDILRNSSGRISFKTATQVSTGLVTGLYEPLFSQVDPMLVGEASRAIQISRDYASRLGRHGENLIDGGVGNLVVAFASHGFVIDREEAQNFFHNIREPNDLEHDLETSLRASGLTVPQSGIGGPIWVLSAPIDPPDEADGEHEPHEPDGAERGLDQSGRASTQAEEESGSGNGGDPEEVPHD